VRLRRLLALSPTAEPHPLPENLLAALTKNSAYLQTVHYILKSGANWKGPIQKFKLTLVKRTPKDKISLCMPDTEKASPTTFVVERTDFTPTEDLQVLFVPANP